MTETPRMIPIKTAAVETGLSYNFLRNLCLQNKIVFVKAGSKYLINYGKLVDFLNAGEVQSRRNIAQD